VPDSPDSDLEVILAWSLYDQATKGLDGESYEKVEPFAWARLQKTLRQIKRRRKKVPA
jgi:hypothetical protein